MEQKELKVEVVDIDQLTPDDRNFNIGNEEGKQLIARSFREHGAGRSVLLDKNNRLIAGNKAAEGAIASGIKRVRIIETTGDELVAVKRTDIDLDSAEGRQMAYLDNLTQQVSLTWDQTELEAVQADVEGFEVSDFGYEIDSLPQVQMPTPADETEDEAIERKRREFEEKMKNGELDEDDPEYQEFLKKFEAKKTTDDCYTPELIYEAVANWVASEYNVSRANFVRPFYPGGDYQKEQYKPTDIVVDNPPFSILSEIQRFYVDKGIRFFLFAPSLTLFGSQQAGTTVLPIDVTCTYENGANVNASFITNLEDPTIRFRSVPELYQAVKRANDENLKQLRKQVPKYSYPPHVVTAAFMGGLSKYGIPFTVHFNESERISQLDSQRESGKAIFGSGYLLSDAKAAEKAAAEKAAAEKAAAEKAAAEKAAAEKAAATRWELSDRERGIIERLNQQAERTPQQ